MAAGKTFIGIGVFLALATLGILSFYAVIGYCLEQSAGKSSLTCLLCIDSEIRNFPAGDDAVYSTNWEHDSAGYEYNSVSFNVGETSAEIESRAKKYLSQIGYAENPALENNRSANKYFVFVKELNSSGHFDEIGFKLKSSADGKLKVLAIKRSAVKRADIGIVGDEFRNQDE